MKTITFFLIALTACFLLNQHLNSATQNVSASASAYTSESDEAVQTYVYGSISAGGIELGGYNITTTGITTTPKSRRFRGSADAMTNKSADGFVQVSVRASVGGRFYDGTYDQDGKYAEAGAPDDCDFCDGTGCSSCE